VQNHRKPATYVHAFLAAAGATWGLISLNVAMKGAVGGLDVSPALRLGVSAIVAETGLALPLALVLLIGRLDLGAALGLRRPALAPTVWSLVAIVGAGVVLDELMFLAVTAVPVLRSPGLEAMGEASASATLRESLMLLVPLALLPSLVEEALCRGVILRGLLHKLYLPRTRWIAVLVSSLFFGMLHIDPLHASAAAAMGVVLGTIALRTGSLVPPVVCHFVNNGISILTPVVGGPSLVNVLDRGHSLPVIAAGTIALCAGLVGLFRSTRSDLSDQDDQDGSADAHRGEQERT